VVQQHRCTCDNTPLTVASDLLSAGVKLPFCYKQKPPPPPPGIDYISTITPEKEEEEKKKTQGGRGEDNFSL